MKPKKQSDPRYTVRSVESQAFELVPPRSVSRRDADMDEVRSMLEAGEVDVAVDELRWLLEECRPMLEAHRLLGEIALADGDVELARGHLGHAYELGIAALPEGFSGTLPYRFEANRGLYEAGKALVWCLAQMGEGVLASAVVTRLVSLDSSDPLELRKMLDSP